MSMTVIVLWVPKRSLAFLLLIDKEQKQRKLFKLDKQKKSNVSHRDCEVYLWIAAREADEKQDYVLF